MICRYCESIKYMRHSPTGEVEWICGVCDVLRLEKELAEAREEIQRLHENIRDIHRRL